jgi:hypothetical protein
MSPDSVEITRLTTPKLAQLLSNATRRRVTEAQVLEVARKGGILQPDGMINLIEYTAVLVREVSNGRH